MTKPRRICRVYMQPRRNAGRKYLRGPILWWFCPIFGDFCPLFGHFNLNFGHEGRAAVIKRGSMCEVLFFQDLPVKLAAKMGKMAENLANLEKLTLQEPAGWSEEGHAVYRLDEAAGGVKIPYFTPILPLFYPPILHPYFTPILPSNMGPKDRHLTHWSRLVGATIPISPSPLFRDSSGA